MRIVVSPVDMKSAEAVSTYAEKKKVKTARTRRIARGLEEARAGVLTESAGNATSRLRRFDGLYHPLPYDTISGFFGQDTQSEVLLVEAYPIGRCCSSPGRIAYCYRFRETPGREAVDIAAARRISSLSSRPLRRPPLQGASHLQGSRAFHSPGTGKHQLSRQRKGGRPRQVPQLQGHHAIHIRGEAAHRCQAFTVALRDADR